jgi:hypothetical protein
MVKAWTTAVDTEDGVGFTCEACADAKCSICGHEACPACIDCCDDSDCLVPAPELGDNRLKKTHECVFTACPEHRP